MINCDAYMQKLKEKLQHTFGDRLVYMGLQGSYLRGEATENSDIDIMLVLEDLRVSDLEGYRRLIEDLGDFDKSCGFICSKADLAHWNPLEICNLVHSTRDYYGNLRELVPAYTREDIRNFVKFSLNNLYHEICHRFVHGAQQSNVDNLPFSYKGVFFILQNLHYLRTGVFVGSKGELLSCLTGRDRDVLDRSMNMDVSRDFRESFELLLTWCQDTLRAI